MYLLPSSFRKFVTRFQSNNTPSQLPTHNQSETTLFDDLPADEKQAALAKLDSLAAQQPGQVQQKHISPVHRRQIFSW